MPKLRTLIKDEMTASVKHIDKGDILLSQILYTLMNFAGGGGLAGMPLSSVISAFIVKGTYDGHRFYRGDENFNKKRRYFFNNMYAGLAGGTLPRIFENITNLALEHGATTVSEIANLALTHLGDVCVVSGGLWNEHSLVTLLAYQLYGHIKNILKTKQDNNKLPTRAPL